MQKTPFCNVYVPQKSLRKKKCQNSPQIHAFRCKHPPDFTLYGGFFDTKDAY